MFRKFPQRCVFICFNLYTWVLFIFFSQQFRSWSREGTQIHLFAFFCDGHAEFWKHESVNKIKKMSSCTRFIRSIFKRIVKGGEKKVFFFVCRSVSLKEWENEFLYTEAFEFISRKSNGLYSANYNIKTVRTYNTYSINSINYFEFSLHLLIKRNVSLSPFNNQDVSSFFFFFIYLLTLRFSFDFDLILTQL